MLFVLPVDINPIAAPSRSRIGEPDMPLLMGLCDRVYAMVEGRVVAEGTPEEIRNNPAVIASYLGTDETAIARSGSRPKKRAATNGEAAAPKAQKSKSPRLPRPLVAASRAKGNGR